MVRTTETRVQPTCQRKLAVSYWRFWHAGCDLNGCHALLRAVPECGQSREAGSVTRIRPSSTSTAVRYFVRLNRLRTGPACDLREAGAPGSYRVNTWTRAVGRSFAGSILLSRLAKTHPAINWLQTAGVLGRQHPPWILMGKSADLIQVRKVVLGQCEFDRRESVLTLVEAFRANDDRGYYRLCQEPCERETRRTTFMCFRDLACSIGGA
jgi:hypothetical protein